MFKIKTYSLNRTALVDTVVEVSVTPGAGIHVVGLIDTETKESLLRVATALQSCGYAIPGKKIVLNITPADLHKSNTAALDLPIALGLLAASEQTELSKPSADGINLPLVAVGELSLDGEIRPVDATEQIVQKALQCGFKHILIPKENKMTGALWDVKEAVGVSTLRQAALFMKKILN